MKVLQTLNRLRQSEMIKAPFGYVRDLPRCFTLNAFSSIVKLQQNCLKSNASLQLSAVKTELLFVLEYFSGSQ